MFGLLCWVAVLLEKLSSLAAAVDCKNIMLSVATIKINPETAVGSLRMFTVIVYTLICILILSLLYFFGTIKNWVNY
jgi:hypothetical protein